MLAHIRITAKRNMLGAKTVCDANTAHRGRNALFESHSREPVDRSFLAEQTFGDVYAHTCRAVRMCVHVYTLRVYVHTEICVRGRALFRVRIHSRSQKHTARGGFHSFRYALELITGNAQLGSFFN